MLWNYGLKLKTLVCFCYQIQTISIFPRQLTEDCRELEINVIARKYGHPCIFLVESHMRIIKKTFISANQPAYKFVGSR